MPDDIRDDDPTHQQLTMLGGFVVFLSVPSAEVDPWEAETIRAATGVVEQLTGESIEIVTGFDAEDQTPRALRQWIRELLLHEADALIELHGSSFGCGHEDGVAAILRMPRLMLFHDDDHRSNAAGADGGSIVDEGRYCNATQLRELVVDWFLLAMPRMRAQQHRRESGATMSSAMRQQLLRDLERREDDDVRQLAAELGLTRQQLIDFCCDDRRFSSLSHGDVNFMAWALRREEQSIDATQDDFEPLRLTPREQRAFQQARNTWRWDDETAARVLQRGLRRAAETRELEAAGSPSRFSLLTRMGWRAIYNEICDEQR